VKINSECVFNQERGPRRARTVDPRIKSPYGEDSDNLIAIQN